MSLEHPPETIVAIDWSGNKNESDQKKHIWLACWHKGKVTLEANKTHKQVFQHLSDSAARNKRLVVGVDFCFSYPEWFLKDNGYQTAFDFWDFVANKNEYWLSAENQERLFWGRPGRKKPKEFQGKDNFRMFRQADRNCKFPGRILDTVCRESVTGISPKSPFQIGGAGAVGTGSLRGIPILKNLRQEGGFSVWPFDEPQFPLIVEIYPRLLTGKVKKSQMDARKQYLNEKRAEGLYRNLPDDLLKKAIGSDDAFDALVSLLAMVQLRDSFKSLRRATDPTTRLEGAVWGAGQG